MQTPDHFDIRSNLNDRLAQVAERGVRIAKYQALSFALAVVGGIAIGAAVAVNAFVQIFVTFLAAIALIPFTSESKDAVADMPEILAEIDLGLKEVAKKLRRYLGRQSLLSERREKEEIIRKILPRIARKLSDVLEKEEPDIGPVVARIMGNLLVLRRVERDDGQLSVKIQVENHSYVLRSFKLHAVLAAPATFVSPEPKVVSIGDGYDYHWKLSIAPGQSLSLSYCIAADGVSLTEPVVEGLDAENVTGARVI